MIFCLFSAQGANANSLILFAKWKGKVEQYLETLTFKRKYIFRPSYISPRAKRKSPNIYEPILELVYPIYNFFLPWFCITAENLARVMVKVAISGQEDKIFSNIEMRKLL